MLRFDAAPDFEDVDHAAEYVIEVTAVSGGLPPNAATATITITVTNVIEPPVFSSTTNFSVAEGTTAVGDIEAQDPDEGENISTYQISGGADMSLFTINSSGTLSFIAAPDLEDEHAAEYVIEVTAVSDGASPNAATARITITVDNVNEPPVFSATNVSVAEGTTEVGVIEVQDPDEGENISAYRISGGADINLFTLDSSSGALSFIEAPDFEDDRHLPVYEIEVTVVSNGLPPNAATATITITVVNVNEPPVFSSTTNFSVREGTTAVGVIEAQIQTRERTLAHIRLAGGLILVCLRLIAVGHSVLLRHLILKANMLRNMQW